MKYAILPILAAFAVSGYAATAVKSHHHHRHVNAKPITRLAQTGRRLILDATIPPDSSTIYSACGGASVPGNMYVQRGLERSYDYMSAMDPRCNPNMRDFE